MTVKDMIHARTKHRAWEDNFITRYGRKFTLSIMAIVMGFVLNIVAMVAMSVVEVAMAREYTALVTEFTHVLIVGIACFTGADALITWKTTNASGAPPTQPPTRSSGSMHTQMG